MWISFNAFSFLLYDTKTLLDGIWSIVQSSQGYCICKGVYKWHFIALNDLRCSALHMHLFCGKYVLCVCAKAPAALTVRWTLCRNSLSLSYLTLFNPWCWENFIVNATAKGSQRPRTYHELILIPASRSGTFLSWVYCNSSCPSKSNWNRTERQKSSLLQGGMSHFSGVKGKHC